MRSIQTCCVSCLLVVVLMATGCIDSHFVVASESQKSQLWRDSPAAKDCGNVKIRYLMMPDGEVRAEVTCKDNNKRELIKGGSYEVVGPQRIRVTFPNGTETYWILEGTNKLMVVQEGAGKGHITDPDETAP